MPPFKKIIAPTDFREAFLEGLKAPDDLAKLFSAQVRWVRLASCALLTVQPPHGEESGAPG